MSNFDFMAKNLNIFPSSEDFRIPFSPNESFDSATSKKSEIKNERIEGNLFTASACTLLLCSSAESLANCVVTVSTCQLATA